MINITENFIIDTREGYVPMYDDFSLCNNVKVVSYFEYQGKKYAGYLRYWFETKNFTFHCEYDDFYENLFDIPDELIKCFGDIIINKYRLKLLPFIGGTESWNITTYGGFE